MTELMSYEEFSQLPQEVQRETMEQWRNHYKTKEIRKALGFDKNTVQFYKLLRELDIPLHARGQGKDRRARNAEESDEPKREQVKSNFSFTLNGLYEGATVSEQLQKLAVLLKDDRQSYRVKVEIETR